jgi:hypothetical protein
MARLNINIGTTANDRTGDPLRTAFDKVNQNFVELYSAVAADVQIPTQTGNNGKYLTTNGTVLSWATISQFSGSYTDLTNKPTIPTLTSQLTNDSDFITTVGVPTSSVGTTGDSQGQIAFDNNYIYYCTANYVASGGGGATVTLVPNELGQSVNTLTIAKGAPPNTEWATVQVSWTLTVNSTTVTVEEITDTGSDIVIVVSGFITLPLTGSVTFTEPGGSQPDIWKRVSWSADTW